MTIANPKPNPGSSHPATAAAAGRGASSPRDGTPIYFLADAHLGGPDSRPADEPALCDLLCHLEGRSSELYLLGDLFDFWFEFRARRPRRQRMTLEALARLTTSGTPVTFVGGNHDYWAGTELTELTGALVERQPIERERFGRRIFLAHGDGLPKGDWGYRMLKAAIRSRPAIAAFRIVPPSLGASIGDWASGLSSISEERVAKAVPPMKEFLLEKLDEGFDAAVVGHVHAPRLWEKDGRAAVIVGDWMHSRAVVSLDASGFAMLRWNGEELVRNPDAVQPA